MRKLLKLVTSTLVALTVATAVMMGAAQPALAAAKPWYRLVGYYSTMEMCNVALTVNMTQLTAQGYNPVVLSECTKLEAGRYSAQIKYYPK